MNLIPLYLYPLLAETWKLNVEPPFYIRYLWVGFLLFVAWGVLSGRSTQQPVPPRGNTPPSPPPGEPTIDHQAEAVYREQETVRSREIAAAAVTTNAEESASGVAARLQRLADLRAQGLISEQVYTAKRQQILQEI